MSVYIFLMASFFKYIIYLFLAALGLHCFAQTFSSCGELLFVVVHGILIAEAALVVQHGSRVPGLRSGGSWALERRLNDGGARASLLHGVWYLPGSGMKPVSPTLAGGFPTTELPGKPLSLHFDSNCMKVSVPLTTQVILL